MLKNNSSEEQLTNSKSDNSKLIKYKFADLVNLALTKAKETLMFCSSQLFDLKHIMLQKISGDAQNEDDKLNSNKIMKKQVITTVSLFLVFAILLYAFVNIGASKKTVPSNSNNSKKEKFNVEVGSKSLDPEVLWRNHFEDKLHDEKNKTEAKIENLKKSVDIKTDDTLQAAKNETENLRHQLSMVTERLEEISEKMDNIQEEKQNSKSPIREGKIDVKSIYDEDDISLPKSTYNYIPETSYVKGILVGGISVSTGLKAATEPVPVVIRLTNRGNLPKKFGVDIKDCRILGSAYGDLSSERAIIRAESMVCQNRVIEEVLTTKIAGMIYGDDGANGIKGKVVDMSQKHIKNAAIGGILSGFSGSMKKQGALNISAFGALSSREPTFKENLRDNTMNGMGNAAEKIADYYLRQAENMSPILIIPGGTKVDILFLKGVYLGSKNIENVIERARSGHEPD